MIWSLLFIFSLINLDPDLWSLWDNNLFFDGNRETVEDKGNHLKKKGGGERGLPDQVPPQKNVQSKGYGETNILGSFCGGTWAGRPPKGPKRYCEKRFSGKRGGEKIKSSKK